MPELDNYEVDDLDEEDYSDMSETARRKADELVDQRQREVSRIIIESGLGAETAHGLPGWVFRELWLE